MLIVFDRLFLHEKIATEFLRMIEEYFLSSFFSASISSHSLFQISGCLFSIVFSSLSSFFTGPAGFLLPEISPAFPQLHRQRFVPEA